MSDTAHYRFQSDQARRLARQVTDAAVREKLRPMYAEDPAMLIGICQAVATEFATIAAANNYWR